MIPAIGYMIGFYILTRMIQLLFKGKGDQESTATIVFGGITLFITALCLLVLLANEFGFSDISSFQ